MRFAALAVALVAPALLGAQDIVVGHGADRNSGAFIREAVSQPHVVIRGNGRLDLPRDSVVTTTLIVIGRDTYLASRVDGNVVVVNGNLFLRPGVNVRGHAVAIGGTVTNTTLGHVGGRIESYQNDVFTVSARPGGYMLDYRPPAVATYVPLLQPAGLSGLLMPTYDRVDGLSLPAGVLLTAADGMLVAEGSVTYRSRLGQFDPGLALKIAPERSVHFVGFVGRDTRTNDAWNYGDLINSATTFIAGNDTRNYWRSNIGEGRLFARIERTGLSFEPFIGARYEKVSPISAAGDVYTVFNHEDNELEHVRRPNPYVAPGPIGSGLIGAELFDSAGTVVTHVALELEKSFTTTELTTNFTQLTFDGRLDFPTFATQHLYFRSHAVATSGDNVTLARFAYLGGNGTLPVLDLLQLGGTELLFFESRYTIPVSIIKLPFLGSPLLTLRHVMGSAGINNLPSLDQEIGMGIGLSALRLEVSHDVSKNGGTKFGVGISFVREH